MKPLKGELVRIKYERVKNKLHDLVGIVLNVRKSSLVLQQDSLKISIGYRKIKHFERCELKDKEMQELVTLHKGMMVFVEYNTQDKFIQTIDPITAKEKHVSALIKYSKDRLIGNISKIIYLTKTFYSIQNLENFQ